MIQQCPMLKHWLVIEWDWKEATEGDEFWSCQTVGCSWSLDSVEINSRLKWEVFPVSINAIVSQPSTEDGCQDIKASKGIRKTRSLPNKKQWSFVRLEATYDISVSAVVGQTSRPEKNNTSWQQNVEAPYQWSELSSKQVVAFKCFQTWCSLSWRPKLCGLVSEKQ